MARINHDDVDKFFDYHIDLKTRVLYIGSIERLGDDDDEWGSAVDFKMAEYAIKGLMLLEAGAPSGDKPITIIFNNPGGSEYHGMAIYDAIRACKNHVTIKVFGYAASMGSLIMQAADHRIMAPHAKYMIHYGSWGSHDHPKIVYKNVEVSKKWDVCFENIYLDRMLEKDAKEAEAGNDRYLEEVLARHINEHNDVVSHTKRKKVKYKFSQEADKRREEVREVLQFILDFDTEFSAEETVELGLADEVLSGD